MIYIIPLTIISWILSIIGLKHLRASRPLAFHALCILIPSTIASIGFLTLPPPMQQSTLPPLDQEILDEGATNNWNSSEQALRDQLVKAPDDINLLTELAGNLIAQEKFDEAITLLENALEKQMHDDLSLQLSTAYFAKGLLHAEKKNYDTALSLLRQAHAKAPSNAPFLPDILHFVKIIENQKSPPIEQTEEISHDIAIEEQTVLEITPPE
ncbi:MAG: tetratricopeptide repeat protein [Alphaproteobacteria bacterium]